VYAYAQDSSLKTALCDIIGGRLCDTVLLVTKCPISFITMKCEFEPTLAVAV